MAAAPAGHVFHVEFGFNDTELTRALEHQNWNLAEKLIFANSQTSFLDEGCGQFIPLYMVLSGESSFSLRTVPRNFHIARLLIQHGANVNFRVPETLMSEYIGPGQSALELVVNFYNQITACSGDKQQSWEKSDEVVIGFNQLPVTDYEDVVELLCDTVFIMLGHGGDPQLFNNDRESLLHRTVKQSMDPHLAQVLCENGAHINAVDADGNTPLIALCSRQLDDSSDTEADHNASMEVKKQFLECFLSQSAVEVNTRNTHGCTALFFCLLEAEVELAQKLLEHGCDSTSRATIMHTRQDVINTYHIRTFSPLLASLCFPKYLSTRTDVDIDCLWMQPVATQHIAHLVDRGYFNKIQILMELHSFLMGEPIMSRLPEAFLLDPFIECLSTLGSLGISLITHMFGATTTTLRQTCMRKVFHEYFLGNTKLEIMTPCRVSDDDTVTRPTTTKFSLDSADINSLHDFLYWLGLPLDLLPSLLIELFRQKLGSQLMYYAQMHYDMLSGSESESLPSGENDSDLEYW